MSYLSIFLHAVAVLALLITAAWSLGEAAFGSYDRKEAVFYLLLTVLGFGLLVLVITHWIRSAA